MNNNIKYIYRAILGYDKDIFGYKKYYFYSCPSDGECIFWAKSYNENKTFCVYLGKYNK